MRSLRDGVVWNDILEKTSFFNTCENKKFNNEAKYVKLDTFITQKGNEKHIKLGKSSGKKKR